ncbi:MAG: AAA family ATPase [Eubacteriales bacterium]|nr:AAA family ATPase [Eubacteriales bacterium]
MTTKILPVGIDDFPMIREQNFYYLDKTKFISELIRTRGMVNLFTRPRRFGKTLIMSMLKSFFEIGANPKLFHGLAIEQDTELCESYQGKFPVVYLTLKGIEGQSHEEALQNLCEMLSVTGQRYSYLLSSELTSKKDKERLEKIIQAEADTVTLKYSLATLMRMLHAHHGQKVILLVDEYDVPLDKSNENGYYDKMAAFLRSFFGEAFKTNPDLHFAVVTGCLRISKESIFTGVNNLKVDSISDNRFDEYFGFTDKNVRAILKDYELDDAYGDIRDWYDGYYFGGADMYCPWDVLNHCDKLLANPYAAPEAYWNNTSSNAIVRRFIDKADKTTRSAIERLVAGKAIERPVTENLTYAEIDESVDNLWSVLYLTGYLTRDRKREAAIPGYTRLVIPNREVRAIFIDKIQKWFQERVGQSAGTMKEMYRALACGNAERAEKLISSQLRGTISYYDQNESFYHGFLVGLLSGNPTWDLKSNRETGMGRSDITLEDEDGDFGIVIEIKRAKTARELDGKSEEALRQIEEKRYAEELLDEVDAVWIYGIAFSEKKCRLRGKRLK